MGFVAWRKIVFLRFLCFSLATLGFWLSENFHLKMPNLGLKLHFGEIKN